MSGINWEPSQKNPSTTYGRIGKILFFKISLDYNHRRLLATRSFTTIATDNRDQQMWIRAGYFPTDEDAKKAAEEQWPVYLKRLGLVPEADFTGEAAQNAIIEAIKEAAREGVSEGADEIKRQYPPVDERENLYSPDYDALARTAYEPLLKKLIDLGILKGPE